MLVAPLHTSLHPSPTPFASPPCKELHTPPPRPALLLLLHTPPLHASLTLTCSALALTHTTLARVLDLDLLCSCSYTHHPCTHHHCLRHPRFQAPLHSAHLSSTPLTHTHTRAFVLCILAYTLKYSILTYSTLKHSTITHTPLISTPLHACALASCILALYNNTHCTLSCMLAHHPYTHACTPLVDSLPLVLRAGLHALFLTPLRPCLTTLWTPAM